VTQLPTSASGRPAIEVARECAAEARRIARQGFGRVGVSHVKGRGNVLTETDLAVEASTLAILAREFPSHAVMSEETAASIRSEGWLWVVDPIDGTKNFSRGIPHFCYALALCYHGDPVLALTLQPLLDEEYLAVAGEGATLNGQPMHVSPVERVKDGVIAVDVGYNDVSGRMQLETALHLWPGVETLRIHGSAALGFAYVAAGRYDLFLHAWLEPWDVAGGLLLVREAGGVVTDRDGGDATIFSRGVIAGSTAVRDDFLALAGHLPWRA